MAVKEIGIIVNGATGRIGSTQHLANALVPIRDAGGLACGGDLIMPKLLLVGRNTEKLSANRATLRYRRGDHRSRRGIGAAGLSSLPRCRRHPPARRNAA